MKELSTKDMMAINGGFGFLLKRFIITKKLKEMVRKYDEKAIRDKYTA